MYLCATVARQIPLESDELSAAWHNTPLEWLEHEEYTTPRPGDVHPVHPVMFIPSMNPSRASSLFTSAPDSLSEDGLVQLDYAGYESPPPANEQLAESRNERRYRMLLSHEYHPSCM
jgi:hypothetical protein